MSQCTDVLFMFIWNVLKKSVTLNTVTMFLTCFWTYICIYRGLISLEDKVYVLEPPPDGNSITHRVYRGGHFKLQQGTCGHGHNISHPTEFFNTTRMNFYSHSSRVSSVSSTLPWRFYTDVPHQTILILLWTRRLQSNKYTILMHVSETFY